MVVHIGGENGVNSTDISRAGDTEECNALTTSTYASRLVEAEQPHANSSGGESNRKHNPFRKFPRADSNDSESTGSGSTSPLQTQPISRSRKGARRTVNATRCFSVLIIVIGIGVSSSFLWFGVSSAMREQDEQFERKAVELVNGIETTWMAYEVAGLHVHEVCRLNCTRRAFREHYEYMISTGLEFQVTSYNPNTTHAERRELEQESRSFYAEHYPEIDYRGIKGLEANPNPNTTDLIVTNRSKQEYYFPVHYLEPVEGNQGAIDFDLYSSISRRQTIHEALSTWKPALTPRLRLVQETDPSAFSVILMHPGVPLSPLVDPDLRRPRDFSSMVVRIPDLLEASVRSQSESVSAYIFDSTSTAAASSIKPSFLGGSRFDANGNFTFVDEIELDELRKSTRNLKTRVRETIIDVSSRKWTVVVLAAPGAFSNNNLVFVVLGGCIILTSCVLLALWLHSNMRREAHVHQLRAEAEAERTAMVVANATNAAKAERDLNDFIAHEVRNPLSAAMSACSFVSLAIEEGQPLIHANKENHAKPQNVEEETRKHNLLKEDVVTIESSLQFINDLLRNMLDMHRAASHQLKIDLQPLDVLTDIFQPVASMLYQRGANYNLVLDCPTNLIVETDRLRLKQITLNLARNSAKFVESGFVRLRATVVGQDLYMYVEDSGPGIPQHKRGKVFRKFQDSLDTLNQGTGIGLNLCKRLTQLLGGDIWHDESYDSGIEGSPGARFVVKLNNVLSKLVQVNKEDVLIEEDVLTDEEQDVGSHSGVVSFEGISSRPSFSILMTDSHHSRRHSSGLTTTSASASATPSLGTNTSRHSPQRSNSILTLDTSGHSFFTHDLDDNGSNPESVDMTAVLDVSTTYELELPDDLTVLFVDDDLVLRKLFVRSVRTIRPTWTLHEAASGEAALTLVTSTNYDLIFLDQYMTSAFKALTGTETSRALRAKGVMDPIVCGLSANNLKEQFIEAGADAFMSKPFPCKKDELGQALFKLLQLRTKKQNTHNNKTNGDTGNNNNESHIDCFRNDNDNNDNNDNSNNNTNGNT